MELLELYMGLKVMTQFVMLVTVLIALQKQAEK